MKNLVKTHNILFITLDTLRYDVAIEAQNSGLTPNINKYGLWEKRHSPGNFTYSSHHAFFAGFLPTPSFPGKHARLFASDFSGSETTGSDTYVYDEANFIEALGNNGFDTICIGGVGFFNKKTKLGNVLPSMFKQSHWNESFGVADRKSTQNQVGFCIDILNKIQNKFLLFLNISAIHQPNYFYLDDSKIDSKKSHLEALKYVDIQLKSLFNYIKISKKPTFCILTSDHGTLYGEDGYIGHRISHEIVTTVPYMDFRII